MKVTVFSEDETVYAWLPFKMSSSGVHMYFLKENVIYIIAFLQPVGPVSDGGPSCTVLLIWPGGED